MTAFIWAQDQTGLIGKDETLPWHLSDDLRFFKQTTLGQIVVMGRKTFEGMGSRPLPKRTNVVLTRQKDYFPGNDVIVAHTPAEVLACGSDHPQQEFFIIGGATVFATFMDVVDTLYVTRLAGQFAGDTYMPAVDWTKFELVSSRTVDDATPALTHTFEKWVLKQAVVESSLQ